METKPYLVSWRVEVDATSPEAAAEIAQIAMQDETREMNFFAVCEIDQNGHEQGDVSIVRVGVHDGVARG